MQQKVTIGVPVFNVSSFIERCAVSLFEQSYQNIEYIFVDDCSPDDSVEILRDVIDRYPLRKKQVQILRHDTNEGVAGSRNSIIKACTGDFLTQVDADDWLDKNAIKLWIAAQEEGGYDIVT